MNLPSDAARTDARTEPRDAPADPGRMDGSAGDAALDAPGRDSAADVVLLDVGALPDAPETTVFTGEYTGWDEGAAAPAPYAVFGREPARPGRYPVFVYTVGTMSAHDSAAAQAWVLAMAQRGFVAASVAYNNGPGFGCERIARKAQGIYASTDGSALTALCSRPHADCLRGIVTAGHSQGAMMALLARDYDERVRATLALGAGYNLPGAFLDHEACLVRSRLLHADRIRVTNGRRDGAYGAFTSASPPGMIEQMNALTGSECTALDPECLRANGSGWVLVQDTDVTDRYAEHCYFNNAAVGGMEMACTAPLDERWLTSDGRWALQAGAAWLAGFVDP